MAQDSAAALHEGHRDRLRARFLREGLDGFTDVQILELILFYAVVRQDTNTLAHRLLDRFGSLADVLDAPVEALEQVEGMTENRAALLHLFPAVDRQYRIARAAQITVLDTTQKVGAWLLPRFAGERNEVVYLLCLDAACRVLSCRLLFRGGFSAAAVSVRKIMEEVLAVNAAAVILAHNHTSGIALPSREDEAVTRSLLQALSSMDVQLLDHIVVAGDDFVSMAESGFSFEV